MRGAAFTLAEVLITLGIIGVVAALTIPNLISKYEKRVIETGFKKTYRELETVIQKNNNEYGKFIDWDWAGGTGNVVKRYFAQLDLVPCRGYYSSTGPVCTLDRLYSTWYEPTLTSARGAKKQCDICVPYMSKDGRIFIFRKFGDATSLDRGIEIIVDVNGKRGRTVMGQDIFVFSINQFRAMPNRLRIGPPEGWIISATSHDTILERCGRRAPSQLYNGEDCGWLLLQNGGNFPDDYPIKF